MVVGLGIDVVEVQRITEVMARQPRFVERILTPAERAIYTKPHQVAGRWAAKEAIAKAVSVRLRWHDVEVRTGPRGEPLVTIQGLPEGLHIHVSITHERGLAAAVAVCEENDE